MEENATEDETSGSTLRRNRYACAACCRAFSHAGNASQAAHAGR